MSLDSNFMKHIQRPGGFDGQEQFKGVWERVTEEALRLLDRNPDITPELKNKAQMLIEDPNFQKRVKDGWDNDTLRGIVDKDPEKQDSLWARGLEQRIKSELTTADNR